MDLLAFVKSQPHLAARLPGDTCDAWMHCLQVSEWAFLGPECQEYMFSGEQLSEEEKRALPKDIADCMSQGDLELHDLCPGFTLLQWLQLPWEVQSKQAHYWDIREVEARWMREWAAYAGMTVRQYLTSDFPSQNSRMVLTSAVADMNLLQWRLLPNKDKMAHFPKDPGLMFFLNIAIAELIVL
jgi:hypothetical protein